jgi:sugar lactone lactonase YvrE
MCVVMCAAALSACGGGNSSPSSSLIYTTPPAKALPSTTVLGGSIQGTALAALSTVSTDAGVAGTVGHANSDVPPATFYQPNGITTDGTSLYIADYKNHTIRQMDIATGTVTTIAGLAGAAGTFDGTGNVGGVTGTARFYYPNAITTDGTNLYVTDAHYTIRKMTPPVAPGAPWTVSTLAGLAGTSGSIDGTGNVGGMTGTARFNRLNGITTDGNYLYVTDANETVRWVDLATLDVRTLAGAAFAPGSSDGVMKAARFNGPSRITTDGTNLYLCDFNNNTIRKIVIATGTVSTLAGKAGSIGSHDATGALATFNQPNGITTDGTNLFVSDQYTNIIRKIVISSGVVTTIAGIPGQAGATDGPVASALFATPTAITTDGVSLYLTDSEKHTIRRIY